MLIWSRNIIWYVLSRFSVGLILLIAVYASLGQYYAPLAGAYKTPILAFLNRYSPVEVQAEQLSVSWHRLSPILELSKVRIRRDTDTLDFIDVEQLTASVNVLASARDRGVRLDHLVVSGLQLDLVENRRALPSEQGDVPWQELWLQFLSTLEYADMITVERSHLVTMLGDIDLFFELGRHDKFRRLNGELVLNNAPLSFVVETNGSLVDARSLRAKAYITAADVNFDRLGLDNVLEDNPIPADLSASTEMWLDWHPTRGLNAQGSFSVPRLDLSKLLANIGDVNNAQSDFLFSYQSPQQWDLSLSNTAFDFHKRFTQEALRVVMARENEQPLLKISAPSINLELIHSVLMEVPALQESAFIQVLEGLKPSGNVKALHVAMPMDDYAATRFSGRLEQVSVSSYQNLPAGKNISGVVRGTAASGSLNISSQQFQLSLPNTYLNALSYDHMQGDFRWRSDSEGWSLRSNRFVVNGSDGNISGFLGLNFPRSDHPYRHASMDLLVGLQDGQVSSVEKYLPFTLTEGLREWLVTSLQEGRVESAAVLYRGSIVPKSDAVERTLQMNFVTRDATLQYSPDWPRITGMSAVVNVDDAEVDVALVEAQSKGITLQDVVAYARPEQGFASWLAIDGDLQADTSALVALLLDSPLKKNLAPILSTWQASGRSLGKIQLGLPLSGEKPMIEAYTIDLDVTLENNQFHQPSARLQFDDINGALHYRHDRGLTSRLLRGRFLGQEVSTRVSSQKIDGVWIPQLALDGTIDIAALGQWLNTPVFDFAKGTAAIKAALINDNKGSRLQFSSMLQGIQNDMPAPFNKLAQEVWPLKGGLTLNSGQQSLTLDIADRLDINAQLKDFSVTGMQIGWQASAEPLPVLPGVYVTGSVDRLVLAEWMPYVDHFAKRETDKEQPLRMGIRQLHIHEIDIFGYPMQDIDAFGDSVLDFWHFFVDDDAARGTAAFYSDGRPPRLALEYLDLDAFLPEADSVNQANSDQFWDALDFTRIPSLDASIGELRRGDKVLGNWAFDLRSRDNLLAVENVLAKHGDLIIEGNDASVGANFYWQRGEQSLTRLDGVFKLGNIAEYMETFGVPATMTSERASFDIQAQWQGRPTDVAIQDVTGEVALDIANGMFLNVPDSATSALNITNLFNFGALVQRLKLDFSDLTNGGVRYDNVVGQMRFAEGTMDILDSIEIEGPSSEFSMSGGANLVSREVDLSLVAILPITGNISLITAATANLPAAVGVYVVSKLFKKQFDKLSSVVYHITGPWEEPVIEFNKLFDVGALPSQQPQR
ncbi:MAG TPA: YhdP family protein [Pseudomonadales bacterium]|nr:YhdP family protein [Pseudomonadales bacterium]